MPHFTDSVDKIITTYFKAISRDKFTYKDKTYPPKRLVVHPHLLVPMNCVLDCGGCCPRFSLDYLPDEPHPEGAKERVIKFNGKEVPVFSILQDDHDDHHCKFLAKDDQAKCKIHDVRPFSCDFELIRFFIFAGTKPNIIRQAPFGRAWNLLRIDGERGALCKRGFRSDRSIETVIRKITRLQAWCDHFGLSNRCSDIIQWANDPYLVNTTMLLK